MLWVEADTAFVSYYGLHPEDRNIQRHPWCVNAQIDYPNLHRAFDFRAAAFLEKVKNTKAFFRVWKCHWRCLSNILSQKDFQWTLSALGNHWVTQVLALQKCVKSSTVMIHDSNYLNQFQYIGFYHSPTVVLNELRKYPCTYKSRGVSKQECCQDFICKHGMSRTYTIFLWFSRWEASL